jgi:hypothetical protein
MTPNDENNLNKINSKKKKMKKKRRKKPGSGQIKKF